MVKTEVRKSERDGMLKEAEFSLCHTYRYSLLRRWNNKKGVLGWIMLNPSTADHEQDDPTICRCIRFAQRFGYGGIYVTNLFALRTADPAGLVLVDDPIGPGNHAFVEFTYRNHRTVAAWGSHPLAGKLWLRWLLPNSLWCLGCTKKGAPRHPLYVRGDVKLQPWFAPQDCNSLA